MLKALSKEMHLDGLRLLAKSGGRSGDYRAEVARG
jgi:molybdenum cofactor biosynthesis enzyme